MKSEEYEKLVTMTYHRMTMLELGENTFERVTDLLDSMTFAAKYEEYDLADEYVKQVKMAVLEGMRKDSELVH